MQENKNQKEQEQKKKHPIIRTFITIVLMDVIIFGFIFLMISLNRCSSNNNSSTLSSSDSNTSQIDSQKLDNKLKAIVNKQMALDGFASDNLNKVNAVTYEDSYPTSFNLCISASSEAKTYRYQITNCNYPKNNRFDNFISYLLDSATLDQLKGEINLEYATIVNQQETYVISKDDNDNNYLTGYQLKDNSYYIYQKTTVIDITNPFIETPSQIIRDGELLFNYYQSLKK